MKLAPSVDLPPEAALVSGTYVGSRSQTDVWEDARRRFGVDALVFQDGIQIAYVMYAETANDAELLQLHWRLWNHNAAPLLAVVLPGEIRVFDCFRPAPPSAVQPPLIAHLRLATEIIQGSTYAPLQQWLSEVSTNTRVDRQLLRGLRAARRLLQDRGLRPDDIAALLLRCLLVRYLEDNRIFDPTTLGFTGLQQVLRGPKDKTYELFARLAATFNGDVLPPLAGEQERVTSDDLSILGEFLAGTDLDTGQGALWSFDFSAIPAELISSIYEELTGDDQSRARGAFYTPPALANFLLDQILPVGGTDLPTVLDPACGSGIFLVGALKRLAVRWRRLHEGKAPSHAELSRLLVHNIHGVDIDDHALSVAAFSCYVAMVEILGGEHVEVGAFPKLVGNNLHASDFFDWGLGAFDVVVGNPPWAGLTPAARTYLSVSGKPIARKQIAHAFVWRALEQLNPDGRCGFVLPSRTTLFANGSTSIAFRDELLASVHLIRAVDLSDFQASLFAQARQPAALLVLGKPQPRPETSFSFWAPHRSPTGARLPGVTIDGAEIHTLSVKAARESPFVWKTAAWGGAADFALIRRLKARFAPLSAIIGQADWRGGEGLQVGGGGAAPLGELAKLPFIPSAQLHPFNAVTVDHLEAGGVHRPRGTQPEIFTWPIRLVIAEGTDRRRSLAAAVVLGPALFKHSTVGVASREESDLIRFKVLASILNSSFAQYFLFLTSGQWGIERAKLEAQDIFAFPCPAITGRLSQELMDLAHLYDEPVGRRAELDRLVYAIYGLNESDRVLVQDVIDNAIERYAQYGRYGGFGQATLADLESYVRRLTDEVNRNLDPSVLRFFPNAISASDSGYALARISTEDTALASVDQDLISSELDRWSEASLLDLPWGVHLRRNLTIVEAEAITLVKPAEVRYWTQGTAIRDVDAVLTKLIAPDRVSLEQPA